MRTKHAILFGTVSILYVCAAYFVLSEIPAILTSSSRSSSSNLSQEHLALLSSELASIRAGGVALLTASALGIAGLGGFLVYTSARRGEDQAIQKNQNDLFVESLGLTGNTNSAVAVGGLLTMSEVAIARPDLRESAQAVAFCIIRKSCIISARQDEIAIGEVPRSLGDRLPLVDACMRLIGRVPAITDRKLTAGSALKRSLANCDLRGLSLNGGAFDVINMTGSILKNSLVYDTTFRKCVLAQTDWTGSVLTRAMFSECDFTASNIHEARLTDVKFRDCRGMPGDG